MAITTHSKLFWTLSVAGAALLVLLAARLLAWLSSQKEQHKLRSQQSVIAEYDVPRQLSPAELGYIINSEFDTNDLLATIALLYAKGRVDIANIQGNDFTVIAGKENTDVTLGDVESSVLGYLRGSKAGRASWSELSDVGSDATGALSDFEDAVTQSLIDKGFLQPSAVRSLLLHKRVTSLVLATVISFAVLIPLVMATHHAVNDTGLSQGFASIDKNVVTLLFIPFAVLVWIACFVYANLVAYIYYRRDGMPIGATPQLIESWSDVAGYQLFLRETEYVRLGTVPDSKDPSMPYCLALGLDPGFVKSLRSVE